MNAARSAPAILGLTVLACSFVLPSRMAAVEKWDVRYLYDENDTTLTITDFKFPSPQRGIAAGYIVKRTRAILIGERESDQPVVLVTSDSGKTWSRVDVKEIPNSLFFLNDSTGWLVSDGGIWFTTEAGRTWKRISTVKNLTQVYFFSATHGFAAGRGARPVETNDGGTTWTPITISPPLPVVKHSKEVTIYRQIAFNGSGDGIIAGQIYTPGSNDEFARAWMDPEESGMEWQNQTSAFLTTHDGGKSWKRTLRGMYSVVSRIVVPLKGPGFAIREYPQFYPVPTELDRFDLSTDNNGRLQREPDRVFTDVLKMPNGDTYLAGYQTPGHVHPSPIPAKVKIERTRDFEHWTQIPVDYRTVARRVWLASPGVADLWAATDTGMILKLENTERAPR